jgi:maltose alpha-D-glucosyltransferase/alpha-amylase
LLRNLGESLVVEEGELRLEFKPTSKFSDKPIRQPERIRAVETEQSNSTSLVDNDYVVKLYRKLEPGINPEIEMGRFLTEVAGFTNTPALLGSVELDEGNQTCAIAIIHAFVENQGDGWTVTAAYLDRFVDEQRLLAASEHPGQSEEQMPYLRYMAQTGKRVAEMHLALASSEEIADFAPEASRPEDVERWIDETLTRAERVFDALQQRRDSTRR